MKNHSNSNIWLKIGSVLFVLWGILHIWVGYNATCLLINDNPYHELWDMLLGGKNAPIEKFQFATDSITQKVQINFIYNFCLDVTGAGLLGVVIGFMLWRHMIPWLAFFMGFFVIGLIDLSFMFLQVTSGHVKGTWETYGGPIIWVLAVLIIPLGLPKLKFKN